MGANGGGMRIAKRRQSALYTRDCQDGCPAQAWGASRKNEAHPMAFTKKNTRPRLKEVGRDG